MSCHSRFVISLTLILGAAACGAPAADPLATRSAAVDEVPAPIDDEPALELPYTPPESTMNGSMNASLNSSMNSTMNSTMNASLNSTMNSTMNAVLNAGLEATLEGGVDAPLDADEGLILESTMNASLEPDLAATLTASLGDSAFAGSLGELDQDLSQYTLNQVQKSCATTVLETRGPDQQGYRIYVPRLSVLLGGFADTGATVTTEGVTYRVLTTYAIACENRAVRVLLLSPTAAGAALRTYEDDVTHMCARFRDPATSQPAWFCGGGTLGAGTPVYAQPASAPAWGPQRVAFPASIDLGGNHFAYHFAWDTTLAPISRRIAASAQNGYTSAKAWGLNPNDHWPDGTSKAPDYLAAVALKATTGRTGVKINPYVRNVAPTADVTRLNDCEVAGSDRFLASPDLASNGTLDGIFVDVSTSPAFADRCASWAVRYQLHAANLVERQVGNLGCRSFDVGAGIVARPRVGLNVVDSDPNRNWCPAGLASFGLDGNGQPNSRLHVASASANGQQSLAVVADEGGTPHLVALGANQVCLVGGPCSPVLGTALTAMTPYRPQTLAVAGFSGTGVKQGRIWLVRLSRRNGVLALDLTTTIAMPPIAGTTGPSYVPTTIAAGNLDADAEVELVTGVLDRDVVIVTDAAANGTWVSAVATGLGRHPNTVVASDLDHDGRAEVLVGTDVGVAVTKRGGVPGPLQLVQSIPTPAATLAIAAGDVDRDGLTDLIVGTRNPVLDFVGVYALTGVHFVRGRDVAPRGAHDLVVADLNQDGRLDIAANEGRAVINFLPGSTRPIEIYFGWGDGYFQESYLGPPQPIEYLGMVVYQADGDPLPDLAALALAPRPDPTQPYTGLVDVYLNRSF
jgi:hypothetical protein